MFKIIETCYLGSKEESYDLTDRNENVRIFETREEAQEVCEIRKQAMYKLEVVEV